MRSLTAAKNYLLLTIAITMISVLNNPLVAQELEIESIHESIVIKSDTSFIKKVSVTVPASDEIRSYPIVYDTELEKVEGLQVLTRKGKRFKPQKEIISDEEDVKLDYITSKKIKLVLIPPGLETRIEYSVSCSELMYLSRFSFFSSYKIDTLSYELAVPDAFRLHHNTIYKDSLEVFHIDSTKTEQGQKYMIKATPIQVASDPLYFFGIYRNIKMPLMRILIAPTSFEGSGQQYMNQWYLNKVTDRRGLNYQAKLKIDELTKGMDDPLEITETLYDFVKQQFKYVAIEVGMGAFVPTHANEVFTKKHGDCKDLSNFLSEALNHKNIKSDIALAATFDHISDCDFPSLSSANHVICLAYIDGQPILLDPTDPIHEAQTPVQSLQNRSILIVNDEGGSFHDVSTFLPDQNNIHYDLSMKVNGDGNSLEGTFNVSYEGITGNFLKRQFLYENRSKVLTDGKKHYTSVFGDQDISDFQWEEQSNTASSKGHISAREKIFKDANNRMLFIDFLPRLIESEERETLLKGTHLGSPFRKTVTMTVELDEAIEIFQPIKRSIKHDGVSFSMHISAVSESVIECRYDFETTHYMIDSFNQKATNDILTSFKKFINEPVIYKKRS